MIFGEAERLAAAAGYTKLVKPKDVPLTQQDSGFTTRLRHTQGLNALDLPRSFHTTADIVTEIYFNRVMQGIEWKGVGQSREGGEAANRVQAANVKLSSITTDRVMEPATSIHQPTAFGALHVHNHARPEKELHAQRNMDDTRKPPLIEQRLVNSTTPLLTKHRHLRVITRAIIHLSLPFYHIERDTAGRAITRPK